MQNYAVARGSSKGPRREGPYDEGFVRPSLTHFKARAHVTVTTPPTPRTEITRSFRHSVRQIRIYRYFYNSPGGFHLCLGAFIWPI